MRNLKFLKFKPLFRGNVFLCLLFSVENIGVVPRHEVLRSRTLHAEAVVVLDSVVLDEDVLGWMRKIIDKYAVGVVCFEKTARYGSFFLRSDDLESVVILLALTNDSLAVCVEVRFLKVVELILNDCVIEVYALLLDHSSCFAL